MERTYLYRFKPVLGEHNELIRPGRLTLTYHYGEFYIPSYPNRSSYDEIVSAFMYTAAATVERYRSFLMVLMKT